MKLHQQRPSVSGHKNMQAFRLHRSSMLYQNMQQDKIVKTETWVQELLRHTWENLASSSQVADQLTLHVNHVMRTFQSLYHPQGWSLDQGSGDRVYLTLYTFMPLPHGKLNSSSSQFIFKVPDATGSCSRVQHLAGKWHKSKYALPPHYGPGSSPMLLPRRSKRHKQPELQHHTERVSSCHATSQTAFQVLSSPHGLGSATPKGSTSRSSLCADSGPMDLIQHGYRQKGRSVPPVTPLRLLPKPQKANGRLEMHFRFLHGFSEPQKPPSRSQKHTSNCISNAY